MIETRTGFTIIELLVSIAIITFIMSTVFYNYGTFNDNLALFGGAQEVALAVRQAQTYGLNVAESTTGSGQFSKAYGVHFDPTDNTHYYIFVDLNGDKKYDVGNGCGSGSTECVAQFTLRNNILISTVCDDSSCPPSGVQALDITFLRPNPDANINFINAGGGLVGSSGQTGKVILISPKGKTSTIDIETTGQISVQ